jgi:hypothetical protein
MGRDTNIDRDSKDTERKGYKYNVHCTPRYQYILRKKKLVTDLLRCIKYTTVRNNFSMKCDAVVKGIVS